MNAAPIMFRAADLHRAYAGSQEFGFWEVSRSMCQSHESNIVSMSKPLIIQNLQILEFKHHLTSRGQS